MDNDNIIPNDGRFYVPVKSKEAQEAERHKQKTVLEQVPVLKGVLKHLEEKILFYDSLNSIKVDISEDPLTFQKVHYANQICRDSLKTERTYIQSEIDKLK